MLNKIKGLVAKAKKFVLTSKEKAVGAFVVTFVSTYLGQNGLTVKDLLHKTTLLPLGGAVVAHLVVWLLTNSQAE